jgi:hypothetical protein
MVVTSLIVALFYSLLKYTYITSMMYIDSLVLIALDITNISISYVIVQKYIARWNMRNRMILLVPSHA